MLVSNSWLVHLREEEEMGMHEERHGKEAVVSDFPPGLRVLAIDNDPVSLKVLEVLLHMRNYRRECSYPPIPSRSKSHG